MDAPRTVESASVHAHKRQFAWQILVPFLVVTVVILTGAVLVAIGSLGATATRSWADVSTIWLLLPLLFFAFLIVIMLGFLIFGMTRLLRVIPRLTGKTQDFFDLLSKWTRKIGDKAIKPVVWIRQAGAILEFHIQIIAGDLCSTPEDLPDAGERSEPDCNRPRKECSNGRN